MAATAARRSFSFLRLLSRTNFSSSPLPSLLRSQTPRISPLPRIRRESVFLSSLIPVHTATASARLVSKLPRESSMLSEDLVELTSKLGPLA